MKTNEYGESLDWAGYAPSILQTDLTRCWLCGARDQKLDRHEPFNGPYRRKSKRLGMWVVLCHERCHFGRIHMFQRDAVYLKRSMQAAAMLKYNLTTDDFITMFGKNWL